MRYYEFAYALPCKRHRQNINHHELYRFFLCFTALLSPSTLVLYPSHYSSLKSFARVPGRQHRGVATRRSRVLPTR